MTDSPPDPKTLEAIEKIKTILLEHDLVGFFSVVSPERAHWLYHLDASWCALSLDRQTRQARIRAKRADFKTEAAHRRVLELTAHAIHQGRDLGVKQYADMQKLVDLLERHFDIEHAPFQDVRYETGENHDP